MFQEIIAELFLPVLVVVVIVMVAKILKGHEEYDQKFSDIDKKISK